MDNLRPKGRGQSEAPSEPTPGLDYFTEGEEPTQRSYPDELGCPEIRELSSDYVEEELPAGLVVSIRRHLVECKNCTAFVNTFRRTIDMMRELPVVQAPDKIRRSILDVISKRKS
ncbi:MAG: zf-HC2 domain-containing protein [Dehalococcoidia bacterium]